jgi:hypothetical protein
VSTAFHFKKCSAERGHLNPESVARALSRALPVSRRASYFASRVVSKCEFPREFVGCSVPVLSAVKPKVFPGFFAFLANCFGFPARPCLHMLRQKNNNSSALPWPLVSRPVSRQSRLENLIVPGKTGGFAAEVVGFELGT